MWAADQIWVYSPPELDWDAQRVFEGLGERARVCASVAEIIKLVAGDVRPGDHVLIMSNGGFENIHQRLLDALEARP
jgi:UDP-N-acetylmuramate: L-alanyl-gamma-D-glutamyl-meso-diaminopimelate ligase